MKPNSNLLEMDYSGSELVIALVGSVGSNLKKISNILIERLEAFGYHAESITVSSEFLKEDLNENHDYQDNAVRLNRLMDLGNQTREESEDNGILALATAALISSKRGKTTEGNPTPSPKKAYIIKSLKRPEEVSYLRRIYSQGFFLIGAYSGEKRRKNYLIEDKRIPAEEARKIMERDKNEKLDCGQNVTETYHLSDFFILIDGQEDRLKNSIWRVLNILFGHPYETPTFDEYAMFLAFAASLRSADLSRQVGAVITKNREILTTGANDCPKALGGLYWSEYDKDDQKVVDTENGRDFKRGFDSNKDEQNKIRTEILAKAKSIGLDQSKLDSVLRESPLMALTEFGRVIHAEMEALLACARGSMSAKLADLFCTTFPCHNCAKHIIAAGIKRVVFIEPYEKSKAEAFHSEAIHVRFKGEDETSKDHSGRVIFEPFVGVGPRRFFDLFSMRLGFGYPLKRKNDEGKIIKWEEKSAKLRVQLFPMSYLESELAASNLYKRYQEKKSKNSQEATHDQ